MYSSDSVVGKDTSPLSQMLESEYIEPGSEASYQLCKTIFAYHPLGKKMTEGPIALAQSMGRVVTIPGPAEDMVRKQFEETARAIDVDKLVRQVGTLARVYGAAGVVQWADNAMSKTPLNQMTAAQLVAAFNVLDPLNVAGSLVTPQDPRSPDFLKSGPLVVQGQPYHPSRACLLINETPLYIEYTSSAFGYTGRSVFQRALFPMKSYIQTMRTNDLITRKAGVIVAMITQASSIADNIMKRVAGFKRNLLKEAETDNVISIGKDDKVESMDLRNAEGPMREARKNILEDIAAAADMPAQILNNETFAEGFGEGTEDAKTVVRFANTIREWLNPAYAWFDEITMYRAWTPEFYESFKQINKEYANVPYQTAFIQWKNAFTVTWPSLLIEPESEKVKNDDVKLKGIIATLEVLLGQLDPENKATMIQWAADNINSNQVMFTTPLIIDPVTLQDFLEEQAERANAAQDTLSQGGGEGGEEDSDKAPPAPTPFAAAA